MTTDRALAVTLTVGLAVTTLGVLTLRWLNRRDAWADAITRDITWQLEESW